MADLLSQWFSPVVGSEVGYGDRWQGCEVTFSLKVIHTANLQLFKYWVCLLVGLF